MKIYRIEMMDDGNFGSYMTGSNQYKVEYYDVEAENEEQALTIAKHDNPSYHINNGFVIQVAKKCYTASEKDKLIIHIAELEEDLANAKNKLLKLEKEI